MIGLSNKAGLAIVLLFVFLGVVYLGGEMFGVAGMVGGGILTLLVVRLLDRAMRTSRGRSKGGE